MKNYCFRVTLPGSDSHFPLMLFMTRKFLLYSGLVVGAAIFAVPIVPVSAQEPVSAEQLLNVQAGVSGAIYATFEDRAACNAFKDVKALEVFYSQRGYEPYWVSRSRAKTNARDFLEIIEKSWRHGFNPYSYHLKRLHELVGQRDEALLGELDVLLSDAYLRLAQDLTGIRVNPGSLKSHWRYWRAPLAGAYLFERLNAQRDIEDLIESFEPQGQTYKQIQRELVTLVNSKPEDYEKVLPIRMKGLLKPNERDESVPDLRLRLNAGRPQTDDPYLYDDRLAAAVIRFQRDNSLKDDGIVGQQTLDILNRAREHKILQLVANLERLRWVEEEKPDTFVVVNVPSAMLWAVEGGHVAFEMPVIVGRKERPTNIFRAEIHGVRLNPDWTVPPTIKRDDILPKLREDPEYLTHKGMQLISGRGEGAMTLDPLVFDWENVTEEELKDLRMVQIPGAHNPLGSIRVLMPNAYNIYLHDTNERHYFERANRAASSGCVRMKDPERMADFILKHRKGWNEEDLAALVQDKKTRDLYISDPIPVYLLYYTVWVNDQGGLVYGQDLYGFDDNLIKMLKDIDGIFIPVDNT